MRILHQLACFAALFLVAGPVWANAAANFSGHQRNTAGALVSGDRSKITVVSEELELSCGGVSPRDGGECELSARYALANQTAEALDVRGAFYGVSGKDQVVAMLDGQPVSPVLSAEEQSGIDAVYEENLKRASAGDYGTRGNDPREREGFAAAFFGFSMAAAAKGSLAFNGTLRPFHSSWEPNDYSLGALAARHPLLVTRNDKTTSDFRYLLFPIRSWGGDPEIRVRIRVKPGMEFQPSNEPQGPQWTKHPDGSYRAQFRASQLSTLEFRIVRPEPTIYFGGPTLGIGGRLDQRELRLRAGFEGSLLDQSVIEAVHLETNLDTVWTVVPSVSAATPSIFFIVPSLSAGLGAPVRTEKGMPTRVGVRLETQVQLPFLGLVFPVDFYPSEDRAGGRWDLSLLGRISL